MAFIQTRSAACFLACAAAACGPIGATSRIADAEIALGRAHAADGEKLAPYETTLADLYLVKAREEQGHAHYADARDLAADCVKQADLAVRKAAERRGAPPVPAAAPASPARTPVAVEPQRPTITVKKTPAAGPADTLELAPLIPNAPSPGKPPPPGDAAPTPAPAQKPPAPEQKSSAPDTAPPDRKPAPPVPGGGPSQ